MEYYIEKKTSVICKRKNHDNCKNRKDHCGCECHVVTRKNLETRQQSIAQADKWLNEKWQAFWRPFLP